VPDGMKTSIFEAFRQGPGARGGVGVGLSLVKRFAELHDGRAWVEDRPGGGASFRVFLPRSGVAADRGPGRIRTRDTRSRAPSRPTAFVR
jgi:signal transduction histidine kinase